MVFSIILEEKSACTHTKYVWSSNNNNGEKRMNEMK